MSWCLGGPCPNCMWLSILDALPCIRDCSCSHTHTRQGSSSNQAAAFKDSSRATVEVGFGYRRLVVQLTCDQSGHVPNNTVPSLLRTAQAKTAKLWHTCSRDITWVAVYLVVQVDLLKWKAFRCGQPTFHWILDCRQWPSRWANYAISWEQSPNLKI